MSRAKAIVMPDFKDLKVGPSEEMTPEALVIIDIEDIVYDMDLDNSMKVQRIRQKIDAYNESKGE